MLTMQCDENNDAAKENERSGNGVHNLQSPDLEFLLIEVNGACDEEKPERRPEKDAGNEETRREGIALSHRGSGPHARKDHGESEQSHGIGKREEKHTDEGPRVAIHPVRRWFLDGVPKQRANAQQNEERSSNESNPVFLRNDEVRDEGNAEGGNDRIDRICGCSTKTGDKAAEMAVRQRPANAHHPHRAYRRRQGEADDYSFQENRNKHSEGQTGSF